MSAGGGTKAILAALFANIPWSTPQVLTCTLERAGSIGLSSFLLPPWYDVDDAASFEMLQAELAGLTPDFAEDGLSGGAAASTRALLEGWANDSNSSVAAGASQP